MGLELTKSTKQHTFEPRKADISESGGRGKEHEVLLEKFRRESLEKSILLELSKQVSSSLNIRKVLNLIINSVRRVIPYEAAGIFLVNEKTKGIYPAVLRGYDRNAIQRAHLKVGRGLIGIVAREGRGIVVPDVSREPRYIDARRKTRSEIIVPLVVRNHLLGALNLESDRLNAFNEQQLELLTAFASHAAIAIDNARLHEKLLKNKQLEFDLIIARKIQKALLPKVIPRLPGYEFATLNLPSRAVSGDLYDVSRLHNHRLGLAIGDVSGKGTPAAILMASIFASYKRVINESTPIAQRIAKLNNILCDAVLPGTYATFFFAELETRNRILNYCNAGHFPPVVIRKNGEVIQLDQGGTVLGFIPEVSYQQAKVPLAPEDILFLYTDGLVEARNRKGEFFTLEGATRLIQNHFARDAEGIKDKILQEIKRFVKKSHFEDDLTFVIMKVLS